MVVFLLRSNGGWAVILWVLGNGLKPRHTRGLRGCLGVLKKCGLEGNVKYVEINVPEKIWLGNRERQVQTDPQRGWGPVGCGSLP